MGNVRIFASGRNWIDTRSVETLHQISKYEGIKKVVGLPDLSVGTVPNGSAMLSDGRLYPHLIGSDIGCGMALFQSAVPLSKYKADRSEKALRKLPSLGNIEADVRLDHHLGTIGRGNHFAELQQVETLRDEALFAQLGLRKKQLYVLVHSGSRALGQQIFDRVAGSYDPTCGIGALSAEGKAYLASHDKAIALAKTSRAVIAQRLFRALKLNDALHTVSDTAHNSILNTPAGYIHRKGAAPATEGAVMIAGTRGSLSYLVMPTADTAHAVHSLAHGAGRKWERRSCSGKLRSLYTKEEFQRTKLGTRVICHETQLLYEEAPEAYKNIDIVIADLVDAGLATVIATFRPLLTFKE